MKYVLFSDCHFGTKNNSMTWWKKQKEFFDKQFIPYIKNLKQTEGELTIICLGDVFDVRASVSTYIMHEVRDLFSRIASVADKFYIICGNHDTYTEQTDAYNSLQPALQGLPIRIIVGSHHNVLDTESTKRMCMIPWHTQKGKNIEEWTKEPSLDCIFTHSDIVTGSPKLKVPVFSGHIHSPYINGKVRNLGSCFPLTFADANQDRYFWIWDSVTDDLQRIPNKHSIKFWRIYNEDVLEFDSSKIDINDYIEIYIKNSLLQTGPYQEKIQKYRTEYKNCWIIPQPDEILIGDEDFECDMDGIIEKSIPDNLKEKFNYIKEKISQSS